MQEHNVDKILTCCLVALAKAAIITSTAVVVGPLPGVFDGANLAALDRAIFVLA